MASIPGVSGQETKDKQNSIDDPQQTDLLFSRFTIRCGEEEKR
jgi:hypothetical protein